MGYMTLGLKTHHSVKRMKLEVKLTTANDVFSQNEISSFWSIENGEHEFGVQYSRMKRKKSTKALVIQYQSHSETQIRYRFSFVMFKSTSIHRHPRSYHRKMLFGFSDVYLWKFSLQSISWKIFSFSFSSILNDQRQQWSSSLLRNKRGNTLAFPGARKQKVKYRKNKQKLNWLKCSSANLWQKSFCISIETRNFEFGTKWEKLSNLVYEQ